MRHAAATAAGAGGRKYGARLVTLKRRPEFLRIRGGARWSTPAFLIEGKGRPPGEASGPRFGFTITGKLGKAHDRNRMRRRLSHALRLVPVPPALGGWDFVIIARTAALIRPFDDLVADFATAFQRLSRKPVQRLDKPPTHVSKPPKP